MNRMTVNSGKAPLAFIISPQPWSGFHVSKHHYAIALADQGWRVVFIDPPLDLEKPGAIVLTETEMPGIIVLRYQTFFPYWLKFRSRPVFDYLMRWQIRRIIRITGHPDLVWDFDNAYQFRNLAIFGAKTSIFHLVDDVGQHGLGTKNANFTFYLHESFCRHAGGDPRPECHIEHGLSKVHEYAARTIEIKETTTETTRTSRIGFVGNLAANWINWDAINTMLNRHPDIFFIFWGPLPASASQCATLKSILDNQNCSFRGLTSSEKIIEDSLDVDIWLIPFHSEKLLGGPLNSHKVLEYLSTGKAVVMNWLEAYQNNPLVNMLPDPESKGLADILDEVLTNLSEVNGLNVMVSRRDFALARSYDNHLRKILAVTGVDGRFSSGAQ